VEAVLKKCFTAQLILTKVAQHSIHNTPVQVPVQFVCTCPIHAQSSANNVSVSLEEVLNYIYCDGELWVPGRQSNYVNASLIMMAVYFSWGGREKCLRCSIFFRFFFFWFNFMYFVPKNNLFYL